MKKFLTLKNILICAGALVLIVMFCLSFSAKFAANQDGHIMAYHGIVWGSKTVSMDGEKYPISDLGEGFDKILPSTVLLIGVILMLVAALAAVLVALLVKKPWAKWLVLGLAVVALAGAVMQFFAKDSFLWAMVNTMAKQYGVTDKAQIKEVFEQYKAQMAKYDVKVTVSILSGVFGIVGALALGAGALLPEKK